MIIIWVSGFLISIAIYLTRPGVFTREFITGFLHQYKSWVICLYFVLCVSRAFTLVPSTPFLMAGILLFPGCHRLLFCIFLLSVFVVASMQYYASAFLGIEQYLLRKYPKKINKVRKGLNKPAAPLLVMLWAFLPFTPTDIVCYAAGLIKMNYRTFIIPLMTGESIICYLYIFKIQNLFW